MNKFCFKIRTTVLSLFIAIFSIIISVSLVIQYYSLTNLAYNASGDNLTHISSKIESKINSLDNKTHDILSRLSLYKYIDDIPKKGINHSYFENIVNELENNDFIYAIYVGNENGDFYEVINLDISEKLRVKYNASANMKWLVIKIYNKNGKKISYEEYFDKNLLRVKSLEKFSSYDPRNRPWYKKAMKSNKTSKTDPYMFSNLEAMGTTFSKSSNNKNYVIGMDISLESMAVFLNKQLTHIKGDINLFNEKGTMTIGANDSGNYKKFNFIKMKDELDLNNEASKFKILTINNIEYYTYFTKLNSIYNMDEFLAILLPLDVMMKPYMEKIFYSFIFSSLLLLSTIPLIWIISKLLVSPMQKLALENKKILNQEFTSVRYIESNIKEINDLSLSLLELANAMNEHENDNKILIDSFIKIIATAIDSKSKYTGDHCERVPILTTMIANAASNSKNGIFKNFTLNTEEEIREISTAAWLHDCGKVTTPEYVVDKATKLETIYNRIHEIRTRFEVLHRDAHIKYLENILNGNDKETELLTLKNEQKILQDEFEFIAKANIGSEFMEDESIEKIQDIAKRTWIRNFDNRIGISKDEMSRLDLTTTNIEYVLENKISHLIERTHKIDYKKYESYGIKTIAPEYLYNLGEVYNLCIKKGTLTQEERYKINEHSIMSIIMLDEIPFLNNLKNVPEFATSHHETLIGTGYPRKLSKKDMSLPARIIALADVFEALTAKDRPYKDGKTLSESIKILSFMVKDQHLDADLFELFLKSGIYMSYAKEHLDIHQIDEVDISKYI